MTMLIVAVWVVWCASWAVSRFGRAGDSETTTPARQHDADAASRRPHPSEGQRIDETLADCDPVWSALDDRQLERLLRDAAS